MTYLHTPLDADDHEPAPVTPDAAWRGRCDFCSDEAPTHVLPAKDFRVPGMEWLASDGAWAACADCTALLNANDWHGLVARAIDAFRRTHGFSMAPNAQQHLRELYQVLRGAITGAPIPLPPREG